MGCFVSIHFMTMLFIISLSTVCILLLLSTIYGAPKMKDDLDWACFSYWVLSVIMLTTLGYLIVSWVGLVQLILRRGLNAFISGS